MNKFNGKTVKCPLCENEELDELGTDNDEIGFGCSKCKIVFVIDFDPYESGESDEES